MLDSAQRARAEKATEAAEMPTASDNEAAAAATEAETAVEETAAVVAAAADRASPPPVVEMSSMRALSWVSLGGGDGSDDPAPLVPGAVMRFGSPPVAGQFPLVIDNGSNSSDYFAILASKRRRRRRRAPPSSAPPTPPPSSDDCEVPSAAAACFLGHDGVGGGLASGAPVEGLAKAIKVEAGVPDAKRKCVAPRVKME